MGQPAGEGTGKLRRVRDVMIPLESYPWVRLQDTILDAITVMEEAQLEVGRRTSLPRVLLVFDSQNELVGIVRRRDIMRGLEPDFLVRQAVEDPIPQFRVDADPHLTELTGGVSFKSVIKGLKGNSGRPISDILKPISTTLRPADQLMKAVYEMVSLDESLIAVVDGDEVVGVVRSVDLLHELAQFL